MVYFASYFALVFALGAFLGFFFGYVYRGRANARRAPAPAVAAASSATLAAAPDDALLAIPGMTPATAAALAGAGIRSPAALGDLAGARLTEVAQALKLEDFALKRFVGLAGLTSLPGVTGDLAQGLVRIGMRDTAELAGANADRVQNKLKALHDAEGLPASVPTRADIVALIEAAAG